ncbi:cytochrome b [Sphingobium lignivorans]|uniref:Cytochrome b561 n=1 Tax=Sphingobium lignivorans TaxID=2735886 RepID=A0ABR6NFB8_9SPHN|nr:cytochrome b/b6 domain-containing protein [Sphingobium lignivorans]MBB5984909.1 cytochrome b561 [Sphingobium lignivorans]
MIEAIRAWAARHTAERRYSPIGQVFHWTMAALILFQLGWGWYMSRLPAGGDKLRAFEVHAEIGLLMLMLALLRLLWRFIVPAPINDANDLGWQTRAAYVTHVLFYICFFGLPLSGWAMWSAIDGGPPLRLAGVIPWPLMPFAATPVPVQWLALHWGESIHAILILLLIVMIPLHVGAALKHHFWNRHDVLRGMLPELPEDAPLEVPRHGLQPPPPPPEKAGG